MKKHLHHKSEIETYKGLALIPHETGVDVVNPVTRKWRTAKSKHQAKWFITLSEKIQTHYSFLLDASNPPIQGGANIILPSRA